MRNVLQCLAHNYFISPIKTMSKSKKRFVVISIIPIRKKSIKAKSSKIYYMLIQQNQLSFIYDINRILDSYSFSSICKIINIRCCSMIQYVC